MESRQAATVVLMLDSPEDDVLSKACEAIYKFVEKCKLLINIHLLQSKVLNKINYTELGIIFLKNFYLTNHEI